MQQFEAKCLRQHPQRQPPRCLSRPFQTPQKYKKQKKTKYAFYICFSLSRHGTKIDHAMYPQKCPKSAQDTSSLKLTSIFDPSRAPCLSFLGPSGYIFTALRNQSFKSLNSLSKSCFQAFLSHSTVKSCTQRESSAQISSKRISRRD